MRRVYNYIAICLLATQFFCCGMERQKYVVVCTANKEKTSFKKSSIKHSLVLGVLYAHQQKYSPHDITIPKADKNNDDIFTEDVRALSCLLKNQGKKFLPYMERLSCNDRKRVACAAYKLGSQRQFAQIVNYFFHSDISDYIGLQLIDNEVQEYMIKQVIKSPNIIDFKDSPVTDWALCSGSNGAPYYIPLDIVHYERDIVCDGVSPFSVKLLLEEADAIPIGAMSSRGNYYVTGVENSDDDKLTLWCLGDNKGPKYQQELGSNEGKITQVVFDAHETGVVIGSEAEENNLSYWKIDPLSAVKGYYQLTGHDGSIGKIIINDEGTIIVSSDTHDSGVIVWDVERLEGQALDEGCTHPVTTMAFSRDSKQLWVCSGPTISLWQKSDSGKFRLLNTLNLSDKNAIVCRLLVNEKAGCIVVGRTDAKINVICIDTMKETISLDGHKQGPINGLIGYEGSKIVVSSCAGDMVDNLMVWDIFTGECLATVVGHQNISAILLTPDMRYIVSQSKRYMYLWEMYTESQSLTMQYINNRLSFLHCYGLYNVYKMKKNGHEVSKAQSSWALSLPIVDGVKFFVEKYLL